MPKNFCLYLYLSFRSRKESFGVEILEAVQRKFGKSLQLHINLDEQAIGGRINKEKLVRWVNVSTILRA